MREVARSADVGFGTVSAYASDKAGLAAMLFAEDLEQLPPVFQEADPGRPLLDQVIENFTFTFRLWATKPELARVVLPMLGNTDSPLCRRDHEKTGKIARNPYCLAVPV